MIDGAIPDPFVRPYSANPQTAWATGLWWPYVQNPNSYLCPVDIQSPDYMPLAPTGRNNKLSSYVMNGATCGYGYAPAPTGVPYGICKVSEVWSPACYLLWEVDEYAPTPSYPNGQGVFAFNDGANFPDEGGGLGALHGNNGGEVVNVGGSVSFVTLNAFQAQAQPLQFVGEGPYGKTLVWWSPFQADGGAAVGGE